MNPQPKTLAELQAVIVHLEKENAQLKADFQAYKTDAEERISNLEAKNAHLKAHQRPSEDKPLPGITRGRFI